MSIYLILHFVNFSYHVATWVKPGVCFPLSAQVRRLWDALCAHVYVFIKVFNPVMGTQKLYINALSYHNCLIMIVCLLMIFVYRITKTAYNLIYESLPKYP